MPTSEIWDKAKADLQNGSFQCQKGYVCRLSIPRTRGIASRATLHARVITKTRVFGSFCAKQHARVVPKTPKTPKTGFPELPSPKILDVAKVSFLNASFQWQKRYVWATLLELLCMLVWSQKLEFLGVFEPNRMLGWSQKLQKLAFRNSQVPRSWTWPKLAF